MEDPLSSCSYNEPFALQVLGDSMEPEFPDQCIVVVERSEVVQHGMYVMALVEGVRWFRQYLDDQEGARLVALNDLYPEIFLAGLEWNMEGIIIQRNLPKKISPDGKRSVKHYKYF